MAANLTPEEIKRYLQGQCHVLALALMRHLGWRMLLVSDEAHSYWENEYDPSDYMPLTVHVYALDDEDQAWDVLGSRPLADVRREVMQRWDDVEDIGLTVLRTEPELARLCGLGEGGPEEIDCPLLAYSEADLDAAWNVAQRLFPALRPAGGASFGHP